MKDKEPVIAMEYEIPVIIVTHKLSRVRTDSFFYDGRNIAVVKYGDKEYVLTTAGEYVFSYRGVVHNSSADDQPLLHTYVSLTDKKIKTMDEGGFIHNWGWFGINVWEDGKLLDDAHDVVYSNYDEAMSNFIKFVHDDIISDILAALPITDEEVALLTRRYRT